MTEKTSENYILIDVGSKVALEEYVNKALADGYKPIGGVARSNVGDYSQAMIKDFKTTE